MEFAIAVVIQGLDVKEERDLTMSMEHVCLEVCLF